MVEWLSNLVAIFQKPELDFPKNCAENDDILGDAYEYLMRHFATESGKSNGQFYTPSEIGRIMAKVLGITPQNTKTSTTAYNTTGAAWTDQQNHAADQALEAELRATGKWMRRITGYAPTNPHREPGWAAARTSHPILAGRPMLTLTTRWDGQPSQRGPGGSLLQSPAILLADIAGT